MGPRQALPFLPRLAAGCLYAVLAGAPVEAGEPSVPPEVAEQLIGALRAARDRKAPVAELTARIAEHAPAGLPLLLAILGDERVPAPPGDPEARVQQLSVVQRGMVLGALEQAGREAVLPRAGELFATLPERYLACVAVDVLGAVGAPQDFGALLDHAWEPGQQRLSERLAEAFRSAATRMLARDPQAYDELLQLAPHAPRELLPDLLHAAGAAHDPDGLPLVRHVLVNEPGLARIAITQIRLMGASLSVQSNEELVGLVRPYLSSAEKETCQAAMLALAELGDTDSVPALLELLAHESTGIRENALWALRRATGMGFPADSRIWSEWYEAETIWLEAEAPTLIQQLQASNSAKVAEAVKHLTRHRLHRHELAERIGEELAYARTADLRVLMCKTLGRLDSCHGLPALLAALEDDDARVSTAAWAALLEVTRGDVRSVAVSARPSDLERDGEGAHSSRP